MQEADALARLEALFLSLYLKEIDQEENVWRALPFFSATLAVEVVAVANVPGVRAASMPMPWLIALGVALALLALCILGVLAMLFRSVRAQPFHYLADEAALLAYVDRLAARAPPDGDREVSAELRRLLVEQLAQAVPHNREVNQRRAQARARAGVLTIASMLATVLVVGIALGYTVSRDLDAGSGRLDRPAMDERSRAGAASGDPAEAA